MSHTQSSIPFLYEKFLESGKVSTDTRVITPGSVFFALKGPKFNANEFAIEALKKGASYAVVDDEKFATDQRCLWVADVLQSLQQLARHHRDQLTIPIIGLTGSNGKTTSKELVNAVLSRKYKTLATRGNLNNHIGVPLTVLSIDASIGIAIVEMGANHVGEIAALCAIANPTHGFITNIGKAHVGTFGGFENIIRGKSELYQHLIQNEGVVWINSQNTILSNMAKRFKNPLMYPAKGDYYHCELIEASPFVVIRAEDGEEVQTQLAGEYNFENIAVALCIGKYFEVAASAAHEAVRTYCPDNMRSQWMRKGSNTILLDAYNANPSSMEAAIQSLNKIPGERKVAILGDMYELEGESEREHQRMGELLANTKIDEVFLCGPLMSVALREDKRFHHFETRALLEAYLRKNPIRSSIVLVKASRGMALEKILDSIN
ncbi:MAG: UDP-N-acetylmuramoyl-tripeptide--D-alanyl-D-alanine ligase [Cyclobacteriaceae bacterium]